MRLSARVFLTVVALVVASPMSLRADEAEDESGLSAELSVGMFSDYMFRGQNLYSGTSIQPSFGVSYETPESGTLNALLWLHVPGENGGEELNNYLETDYNISYSYTLSSVTLTAGALWYRYPHNPGGISIGTQEVYLGVAIDAPLSPTLTVYHDYDAYDGQFYELAVSHAFTSELLGDTATITPFASLGFATNLGELYESDGLETVTTGVQLDVVLNKITVSPVLNYTFKVDDLTINTVWGGVSIASAL